SQASALQKAQARAIQQCGHEARHAFEAGDDGAHLVAGQDYREMLWPPRPNNVVDPWQVLLQGVPIQEQQRPQRLVLCRRGQLSYDGERAEKLGDLRATHLGGVALAVKEDEAALPTSSVVRRSNGRQESTV